MNTKKLAIFASAIITAFCGQAAKELVDGYTWEYSVSGGMVTVIGVDPVIGDMYIPAYLGGYPVKKIGPSFMEGKSGATHIVVPNGVTEICNRAFEGVFTSIYLPPSVCYIDSYALIDASFIVWKIGSNVNVSSINVFLRSSIALECEKDTPDSLDGQIIGCVSTFRCKRQFAKNWIALLGAHRFAGYIDDVSEVEIVSSAMRKDDPTVMDVVYKVHSSAQTVKVRAMAWENGERNLSKAIRPTKWIEGTEANIGDAVTANKEHKLSWRIAGDWATDLSKVKLEVLAVEDDLLPLELQTIPATATHQKMKISWNKMTADHVFDALLWLYADGDTGLMLTNGQLKNGANLLASGTSLYNSETAVGYVFGKMGYQKLAGDELAYARRVTQLELPVSGVQQFAVKYPDAK